MKSRLALSTVTAAILAVGIVTNANPARADEVRDAAPHPLSPSWCAGRCDSVITDWNLTAFQVIKAGDGYADPMSASRSLAMLHAAMHDAANAARPRYQRYALDAAPAGASKADAAVAAAQAAHDVLVALYPQTAATAIAKVQIERTMFEAGIGAIDRGRHRLGKAAAAAVLAKRADDGANGREPYVGATRPGQYRFTPPFDFAAAPHWRQVTPFVLASTSQFRTAPAPALTSEAYRRAFEEVQRVGGKTRRAAHATRRTTRRSGTSSPTSAGTASPAPHRAASVRTCGSARAPSRC